MDGHFLTDGKIIKGDRYPVGGGAVIVCAGRFLKFDSPG